MRHRTDLTKGSVLPSTFINAMQEFIGALDANFLLKVTAAVVDPNQVTVSPASPGERVSIGIMGRWRWNDAAVVTAHPGGAAGSYDVYVTSYDNDLSQPDPADATNYGFGLAIEPAGTSPGTPLYRLVGKVYWDGSKITDMIQLVGAAAITIPVGICIPYTGASDPLDPRFKLADGRLVDRSAYPLFYGVAGHAYNGPAGADPGGGKVRLPDKRGRGSVGPDNMGTATGAAGMLTAGANHQNVRGRRDGFERHQLAAREGSVNDLAVVSTVPNHRHGAQTGDTNLNHLYQGGGLWFSASAYNGIGSYIALGSSHSHPITDDGGHGHTLTGRTADNPHNNMHPYEVDNWIVRVA